jgi:hypothetical protein
MGIKGTDKRLRLLLVVVLLLLLLLVAWSKKRTSGMARKSRMKSE